jgi:predicted DNA-binding antitoxin AbrB/MazE fold protein
MKMEQSEEGMNTILTAVYEEGMLKPLQPLTLPEHSRVRLQIIEAEENDGAGRVETALIAAGLIKPLDPPPDLPHISEERLAEIADRYAVGGALSEVIIAEREGR